MHVRTIALFLFMALLSSMFYPISNSAIAQEEGFITNSDLLQEAGDNIAFAMYEQSLFVTVSQETEVFNGYDTSYFQWIASDQIVNNSQWSFLRIQPYQGGCDPVTDPDPENPCGSNGSGIELFGDIEPAEEPFWHGHADGLWCGVTDCFTWFVSTNSSYPSQLQRYTFDGSFTLTGYKNSTSTIQGIMSGIDTNTGGLGGITVYTVRNGDTLFKTGGTSLMQDVGTAQDFNRAIGDIYACHELMPFCETSHYAVLTDFSVTGGSLVVRNLADASICTSTGNENFVHPNTGVMEYDYIHHAYLVSDDNVDMKLISASDCSQLDSSLALTSPVTTMIVDGNIVNATYVLHNGNVSPTLQRYQLSNTDIDVPLDFDSITGSSISGWISGNTLNKHSMALDRITQALMITGSDAKTRIIYLPNFQESGQNGGEPNSELCFTLEFSGKQICYPTDENGNPIVGSVTEIVGTQNPLTSVVGQYMCQVGINDDCTDGSPTNTNVKTNGIGFILWFLTWAVLSAIIGSALYGRVKMVENIMVIFVVLLISTALAITLNWIDTMYLYLIIFIVIGLASVGGTRFVLGHARGGGGSE